MGKPIKKKYMSARDGSALGDITVTTTAGDEVVINQKGTGVYTVASGRVKLCDGAPTVAAAPGVTGDAQLQHDGRNVRKISQYRVTYFDDGVAATTDDSVWRDKNGNLIGTFNPILTTDGGTPAITATATATVTDGAVDGYVVTLGGSGYTAPPVVTIGAPDGTSAVLGAASLDAVGAGTFVVTDGGSGYTVVPAVTQTGGTGTGATFTATVVGGVVTAVTGNGDGGVANGGVDYVGDETFTIDAVVTVQATATATISGGVVDAIVAGDAGAGYATAPTVTIAAP